MAHHGDETPNEAEVSEVVGVDGGGRVDLQTVVVLAGVLEQAVHGVEHLVGQQEEPLPGERVGGMRDSRSLLSHGSLRQDPPWAVQDKVLSNV